MIILLLVFIILLVILYEFGKNFEFFENEKPSPIKLAATSTETIIKLYWHKPSINTENMYSYLIYMKEPNKDINLTTMKYEGDKLFYEKTFNGLEMFLYQGQKSFYLWNNINPEIDDELIELLEKKIDA